jgi:hypothetical protein
VIRNVVSRITIHFPPEVNSNVMSLIHRFSARIESIAYEEPAHVEIILPPSRTDAFLAALRDATGARATVEEHS